MTRRLVKTLIAIAVAIGATLAPASPASAHGKLKAVCVFTGHANVFSAPVIWIGGGGNFSFDNSGNALPNVCADTHNGTLPGVPRPIGITASGTYQGLVCGTSNIEGDATGDATITTGALPPTAANTLATVHFSIPFVAGQGVILGDFRGANAFAGHEGPVLGAVTIFPNTAATAPIVGGNTNVFPPGLPPNGVCMDNYGVAGSIALYG